MEGSMGIGRDVLRIGRRVTAEERKEVTVVGIEGEREEKDGERE